MLRKFPQSLTNIYLHQRLQFNFAKIIKLTPKDNQQSINESLIKSINTAKDMFKQFSTKPLTPTKLQTSINDLSSTQQQFIDFINSLNQQLLQNKIMNSQQKSSTLIKRIKQQNIIKNGVQCLINQKSFTQKQKNYITNFFLTLSQLFKKNIYQGRNANMDIQFFKQFMQSFNQYMIIMNMNSKLLMNYLFLINHLIRTKTVDSSRAYFVNQKIIIDHILENKTHFGINKKDLIPLFTYLSSSNVISNYPQRYYQFVEFLLSKLQQNWYNDIMFKNKWSIMALYNLNYRSNKIINGFKEIMNTKQITKQNIEIVLLTLNAYINLRAQIFSNTNQYPQQILKPLSKIVQFIRKLKSKQSQSKISMKDIENIQLQIYKILIPTLFRCSIWENDIWMEFAQWLDKDKNYQKLPIIQIYTIMDLLNIDHDIIPTKISQRLLQCKKNMLINNNFRIQDVDLIKVYHKQFGQRMRASYTSQQQIANNLRSVSQINIKTQSLIHFFLVDILMNNNTIIEINNQMHYIMDQGQISKVPNVKSAFRKRILQKLGYKFMQFEVDTFVQGNYQFLKIVEKQFHIHKQQQLSKQQSKPKPKQHSKQQQKQQQLKS